MDAAAFEGNPPGVLLFDRDGDLDAVAQPAVDLHDERYGLVGRQRRVPLRQEPVVDAELAPGALP